MPVRQSKKKISLFAAVMLICSCLNSPRDSGPEPKDWSCTVVDGDEPDFSSAIGCEADFTALASEPLDASIPGATSVKTVIDLAEPGSPLYFQNSREYQIHWDLFVTHQGIFVEIV